MSQAQPLTRREIREAQQLDGHAAHRWLLQFLVDRTIYTHGHHCPAVALQFIRQRLRIERSVRQMQVPPIDNLDALDDATIQQRVRIIETPQEGQISAWRLIDDDTDRVYTAATPPASETHTNVMRTINWYAWASVQHTAAFIVDPDRD